MSAVAMGLLLAAAATVVVTRDSAMDSGIQPATDSRTSVSSLTDHQQARLNTTLTSVISNVSLKNIKTEENKYLSTEVKNMSNFKEIRKINENKTDEENGVQYISLESDVLFSRNHYEDDSFVNLSYEVEGVNDYVSEKEDLLLGLSEDGFEKLENMSNEDNVKVENNTISNLTVNNGTPYEDFPIKRIKRDHLEKEEEMNYTNTVNDVHRPEVLQITNQQHRKVNKSSNSPRKEMEYSEEDISVGVQTADDKLSTDAHQSKANSFHWPPDLQELDQVQYLHRGMNKPRLFPSGIVSAELYLPLTCLIEWEECKMDAECCKPFFCSTLPKFPAIDSLRESASLEVSQVCSRFKTTSLQDKNKTHFRQVLDSYKRKMLEVAKS